MRRFIEAVRSAVAERNWYGALALALTLPDICGKLEEPDAEGSQGRYVRWFDRFLLPRYTSSVGPDQHEHVFLGGEDCYALRCSYLHEGSADINLQRARQALDSFHFIAPRPGLMVHCNQSNSVLQLQVDVFCNDMCQAVEKWLEVVGRDPMVEKRSNTLLEIHGPEGDLIF